MSFGDHATFIVGGAGHGVGGLGVGGQGFPHPDAAGPPTGPPSHGPAADGPADRPGTPSRPSRNSRIVVLSTVIGTVFTAGAFFIALPSFLDDDKQTSATPAGSLGGATSTLSAAPSQTEAAAPVAARSAGAGGEESAAPNDPPVIFDDVVTLDSKTGVDLDGGQGKKLYKQTADADLYLDSGYILYTSARHSATYDDSYNGPQDGAYGRCQTYRLAAKQTEKSRFIGGGNQQYCFTTSAGNPAWVQAINQVDDGGLLVKVAVWRE
jgi:hypothetical protein